MLGLDDWRGWRDPDTANSLSLYTRLIIDPSD